MTLIDYNLKKVRTPFSKPEILCTPPIIPPLHGLNPRTIKGSKWWDIKRREAYETNMHHCWVCGVGNTRLEGHEVYKYTFTRFEARLIYVCALCWKCHNFIHRGRLLVLCQAGKIPQEKYIEVSARGLHILKKAKMINEYEKMIERYSKKRDHIIKNWSKWHLIIDKYKYYSKFKTVQDWENHKWE